jgi:hypothetical protein
LSTHACVRAVTCMHRPIDPTVLYHQQQHLPALLPPLHFIIVIVHRALTTTFPFYHHVHRAHHHHTIHLKHSASTWHAVEAKQNQRDASQQTYRFPMRSARHCPRHGMDRCCRCVQHACIRCRVVVRPSSTRRIGTCTARQIQHTHRHTHTHTQHNTTQHTQIHT